MEHTWGPWLSQGVFILPASSARIDEMFAMESVWLVVYHR